MDIIYPSDKIYIASSTISGLGIFARKAIKKDEVIEVSPIIEVPEDEVSSLTKTRLFDYYFAWGNGFKCAAVALGFGSLFNHSYRPNAKYIKMQDEKIVKFVSIKDIKQEEEITVNYNGHPDDQGKLWFEARKDFGR